MSIYGRLPLKEELFAQTLRKRKRRKFPHSALVGTILRLPFQFDKQSCKQASDLVRTQARDKRKSESIPVFEVFLSVLSHFLGLLDYV